MRTRKQPHGGYLVDAGSSAAGPVTFQIARSEDNPKHEWSLSAETKAAHTILGNPERALKFPNKRSALVYLAGAVGCTCSQRAGLHADACATMLKSRRK